MKITTRIELLKKGQPYEKREKVEAQFSSFSKLNGETFIQIVLPSGDTIYIPDIDFLHLAEFLVKRGRG
jgi:hypothetical protein